MTKQPAEISPEELRQARMARRIAKRQARFNSTKSGRLLATMKTLSKDKDPLALAFE